MKFRRSARWAMPCFAAAIATSLWPQPADAQTGAAAFPSKPVHIVVGFAAGGGLDVIARIVGQKLSERWDQPVLVENKTGAGGAIAAEYVARAPADGSVLLIGPMATMAVNPAVYTKLPYSVEKDFVPVSMVASFPLILLVDPSLPIHSVPDLVAYAKANPRKANYAAAATSFQLATELFKLRTGAPMEYVGYKGSNLSVAAVVKGEVLMTMVDSGPASTQLKAGQVRGLAVTSPKRTALFPELPTMAEAGVPGVEVVSWAGFFAPAGTPAPVVTKIQDEVARTVRLPDVIERFHALALDPVGNTSQEFAQILAADIAKWTEVARAAHIQIEP